MTKKETTKTTAVKKEPVKTTAKKAPVKTALKKEPVKAALKKEPAKTVSKNSEVKISHFEKQFMTLLDDLAVINKKHEENDIIDTVKKADERFFTALKNGSTIFFHKPTYDSLHHFKRICKREIAVAEHEYRKHKGLWHPISLIVNSIQSILSGLSAVPALVDAATSKLGKLKPSYRGHKTARKHK